MIQLSTCKLFISKPQQPVSFVLLTPKLNRWLWWGLMNSLGPSNFLACHCSATYLIHRIEKRTCYCHVVGKGTWQKGLSTEDSSGLSSWSSPFIYPVTNLLSGSRQLRNNQKEAVFSAPVVKLTKLCVNLSPTVQWSTQIRKLPSLCSRDHQLACVSDQFACKCVNGPFAR